MRVERTFLSQARIWAYKTRPSDLLWWWFEATKSLHSCSKVVVWTRRHLLQPLRTLQSSQASCKEDQCTVGWVRTLVSAWMPGLLLLHTPSTKMGCELDNWIVRRRDSQSLRLCCLQGLPSPQAMWSPGLLAWHPWGSNALPEGRAGMYNSSCGLCQNALKSIRSTYCTSLRASVRHLHDTR